MPEAAGKAPPAPAESSSPALQAATDQVARWRSVIDRMRLRTDTTAKALGALGGSALTAIGIAKVADVYPFPEGASEVWAVLTVLGFVLMAFVVAAFTARLSRVSAPVFTTSSLEDINDVDGDERELIGAIFTSAAQLNGEPSLRAYEARAHRLERIAERSSGERRKRLGDQAAVIRAEVQATQGRAAADVIRLRASRSFTDARAWLLYVAAVAGFLLFAIGADYLDGERSGRTTIAKEQVAVSKEQVAVAKEQVAVAKECAAAIKAYGEQQLVVDLPGCPQTSAGRASAALEQPDKPTPADVVAGALADLSARHAACLKAAGEPGDARCAKLRRLIRDATATS